MENSILLFSRGMAPELFCLLALISRLLYSFSCDLRISLNSVSYTEHKMLQMMNGNFFLWEKVAPK